MEFCIEVPKMTLGKHLYNYKVGKDFFEKRTHPDVKDSDVDVKVDITRTSMLLDALFTLQGTIQLHCDRCLEPFIHPVEVQYRIVFSFDRSIKPAIETEVVFIDRNIQYLNIASDLYDFISLQVPYRKVPDERNRDHLCLPEYQEDNLYGRYSVESENEYDPRWEQLKQLKDKMN